MTVSERIAEQVARLPPGLRQLHDAELAAGGELIDLEIGRGQLQGTVVLVFKHPFRTQPSAAPAGILYREITNHDSQLFEFYTADEKFILLTAKFKPMVFEKVTGPENPTESHIARMKEIEKRDAQRAAERAAAARLPPPSPHDPALTSPGNRFLASMVLTFDMWHDGLGYDLDALDLSSPEDKKRLEVVLINHHPRDWRDIEALARIDSPTARVVVEAGLKSSDAKVRREAIHHAGEKADPNDREKLPIQTLTTQGLYDGLSEAIDEVPDFHPPAVVEALFRGALNGDGEAAVHFAALLLFLHGKAAEPFDWNQRPFFLRFNTKNRAERIAVFKEMCEMIGAKAKKYGHWS